MNINDMLDYVALLSQWIKAYDRIFLVKDGIGDYEDLTVRFVEFISSRKCDRNILLLSSTLPPCFSSDNAIKIDVFMEKCLIKLFHLYSFSDKFYLIAESHDQGDIFNFVRTGQLSMEEVFLALVG